MQMTKEILRSTIVTVGSLMFLVFVDVALGRRASILLLCGGIVALVAGLIFQITDQQSSSPLGHRIVNSYGPCYFEYPHFICLLGIGSEVHPNTGLIRKQRRFLGRRETASLHENSNGV
jgi:hypothetical protein